MKKIIYYHDIKGRKRIFKPGVTYICEICPQMKGRIYSRSGNKTRIEYKCGKSGDQAIEGRYKCPHYNQGLEEYFG